MAEKTICPFCGIRVDSDVDHCEHLISILDAGYVEWDDELAVLNDISNFIMNYHDDKNRKEMNKLLKGLKLKKYISIDTWDTSWLEDDLESMSKEIEIIESSYDHGYPGSSGVWKYLFINNMENIQWIIDEFTLLYERLLDYDLKNLKLFTDG